MHKLLRAVLISAAATGVFAAGLAALRKPKPVAVPPAPTMPPPPPPPRDPLIIDADRMSDMQREALLDELDAQLS